MKSRRYQGQVVLPVSFAAAALLSFATPAFSVPPPVLQGSGGAAGMIVHIDPQTGAVLSAPAPGTVPLIMSTEQQNAFSTSHQGLVEVPAAVPGGGFKLDLQGRFQSPLFVTVQPDGESNIQHLGVEPGAH